MTVVNTSGWDTDSNAGDVGSVCGVFARPARRCDGQDWRGPVADRLYLPTADGGSTITDAAREALALASYGRIHVGRGPGGAEGRCPVPLHAARLRPGLHRCRGHRRRLRQDNGVLAIRPEGSKPVTVTTPAFIPPEALDMPIYGLIAEPDALPGPDGDGTGRVAPPSAGVCLALRLYDENDALRAINGPAIPLSGETELTMDGAGSRRPAGRGGRDHRRRRPGQRGPADLGRRAGRDPDPAAARHDLAAGLGAGGGPLGPALAGAVPDRAEPRHRTAGAGRARLARLHRHRGRHPAPGRRPPGSRARVQGLRRYYALELAGRDTVRLVRGGDRARRPAVRLGVRPHVPAQRSTVDGDRIAAAVDGEPLFEIHRDDALDCGGVALTVTEGRTATQQVRITTHLPRGVIMTAQPLSRRRFLAGAGMTAVGLATPGPAAACGSGDSDSGAGSGTGKVDLWIDIQGDTNQKYFTDKVAATFEKANPAST